jgi:hypothetical protein
LFADRNERLIWLPDKRGAAVGGQRIGDVPPVRYYQPNVVERRVLGTGGLSSAWPAELQRHYARGFSVARLGLLLTIPRFLPATGPVAMHSQRLMSIAVRVMGNLVTDEDVDWLARVWRRSGAGSRRLDARPPFS